MTLAQLDLFGVVVREIPRGKPATLCAACGARTYRLVETGNEIVIEASGVRHRCSPAAHLRVPLPASDRPSRDRSIAGAERNASNRFLVLAREALERVLRDRDELTADDLWRELDRFDVRPHEPRALGSVLRRAMLDGLVRPTSRYVSSARAACHGRKVQVWERMSGSRERSAPRAGAD